MQRCKNCNEKLTKLNKDICPYCGCEKPIEKSENTLDITQVFDKFDLNINENDTKKLRISNFLSMFLGVYSIDLFYMKKIKLGIIRLFINLLFYLVICLPIYFSNNSLILLATLLPLGILHFFYLILGIISLILKNKKNRNT